MSPSAHIKSLLRLGQQLPDAEERSGAAAGGAVEVATRLGEAASGIGADGVVVGERVHDRHLAVAAEREERAVLVGPVILRRSIEQAVSSLGQWTGGRIAGDAEALERIDQRGLSGRRHAIEGPMIGGSAALRRAVEVPVLRERQLTRGPTAEGLLHRVEDLIARPVRLHLEQHAAVFAAATVGHAVHGLTIGRQSDPVERIAAVAVRTGEVVQGLEPFQRIPSEHRSPATAAAGSGGAVVRTIGPSHQTARRPASVRGPLEFVHDRERVAGGAQPENRAATIRAALEHAVHQPVFRDCDPVHGLATFRRRIERMQHGEVAVFVDGIDCPAAPWPFERIHAVKAIVGAMLQGRGGTVAVDRAGELVQKPGGLARRLGIQGRQRADCDNRQNGGDSHRARERARIEDLGHGPPSQFIVGESADLTVSAPAPQEVGHHEKALAYVLAAISTAPH